MTVHDWVFAIAGLASVGAGVLSVTRRNAMYSAVFLLVTLVGVAVIFYLLAAPFLAAMQVLVYAGAILVLFLFVIMLLNLKPEDLEPEAPPGERLVAGGLVALLLLVLAFAIVRPGTPSALAFPPGPADAAFGSIQGVGRPLFEPPYVVPFELISVLIVVAIVGAVALAKRKL